MAKYIDAEKLTELCNKIDESQNAHLFGPQIYDFLYHVFIPKVLEETSGVDVIEVVRCKDCKFYHKQECAMDDWHFSETKESDFCSFGQKKEEAKSNG